MKLATLFLIFFSASVAHAPLHRQLLTVWNVGQGQWITYSDHEHCLHFDVGGEFAPGPSLRARCRNKENKIFLSHWDWDHIGLLKQLRSISDSVCIELFPRGSSTPKKKKLLALFRPCPKSTFFSGKIYTPRSQTSSNSQSHVVKFGVVLIPGDSPSTEERKWIHHFKTLSEVRILILGHHGSATSTSDQLLRRLSSLRMSIASARFRRYGHPHPKTLLRLSQFHQTVLRTEDWGHIVIEL